MKHVSNMILFALAALALLALASCATGDAYKQTVEAYVENLSTRQGQCYAQTDTPELKRELVLQDASLACLVDEDRGESTADKKSDACKCADSSGRTWQDNCRAFVGSIEN